MPKIPSNRNMQDPIMWLASNRTTENSKSELPSFKVTFLFKDREIILSLISGNFYDSKMDVFSEQ